MCFVLISFHLVLFFFVLFPLVFAHLEYFAHGFVSGRWPDSAECGWALSKLLWQSSDSPVRTDRGWQLVTRKSQTFLQRARLQDGLFAILTSSCSLRVHVLASFFFRCQQTPMFSHWTWELMRLWGEQLTIDLTSWVSEKRCWHRRSAHFFFGSSRVFSFESQIGVFFVDGIHGILVLMGSWRTYYRVWIWRPPARPGEWIIGAWSSELWKVRDLWTSQFCTDFFRRC